MNILDVGEVIEVLEDVSIIVISLVAEVAIGST